MKSHKKMFYRILLPIIITIILTPITPWLDLNSAHFFFEQGSFSTAPAYTFFYHYGIIPAWIAVISSSLLYLLSFFTDKLTLWRPYLLVMILTLVLGSGIIVHALLKENWGRPRPRQIEEFGGMQKFRPYYIPNFSNQFESSKSFSCGHCSMGFYFFALALVGTRLQKRWLSILGYCLAFGLGIALSLTRIAQGGHFFSDTLITALIMWLTACVLDWVYFERPSCKA